MTTLHDYDGVVTQRDNESVYVDDSLDDDLSEEDIHKGGFSFGMIYPAKGLELFPLIRSKQINQRDVSVLFAMMCLCDARTGRIRFMVKNLAEEFGIVANSLSSSLSRLKKVKLIAPFQESNGGRYFLVNPRLFSVGGYNKRKYLIHKFDSAFESKE